MFIYAVSNALSAVTSFHTNASGVGVEPPLDVLPVTRTADR